MKKCQQVNSRKRCRRIRQLQKERTLWALHVKANHRHLQDRTVLVRMARQGQRRQNRALMGLMELVEPVPDPRSWMLPR